MIRKWISVVVAVLGIIVIGMPHAIGAKKETVGVDGYRVFSNLRGVGIDWVTPLSVPQHWISHVRQLPGLEIWEGHEYLQGKMLNTINFDAYIECSEDYTYCSAYGNVVGTAFVTLEGIEGGWDGSYDFEIMDVSTSFSFEGFYCAKGWGELEGWSLELYVIQDGLTHTETFSGFAVKKVFKNAGCLGKK